jgi:uncharacterized membrane protein
MAAQGSRFPAALALIGSILGVVFATYSTLDYANHLDRRLHDIHCSIIPGAAVTSEGSACRDAMYSPYSAVLKEQYWGGVPISLFALGAFAFFFGFAVYLLLSGARAPKQATVFFAFAGLTPLLVSVVMFTITMTQLEGKICKTCGGIYISSVLLALGALLNLRNLRRPPVATGGAYPGPQAPPDKMGSDRPQLSLLFPVAWLLALAVAAVIPARVYASSMPDHRPYLRNCGELKNPKGPKTLLHLPTTSPVQQATLFEDPLCPTCKAFHKRMLAENLFERLDVTMVMFPLDSECNWMLDEPLHPGACIVAKAVLCGGAKAREVLEWSYDEQEQLTAAGKAGKGALESMIEARWGASTAQCVKSKETTRQLNEHLHYAVDNSVPVSTPQMYLSGKHFCDEDTDIGLRYTMAQLAPEVVK